MLGEYSAWHQFYGIRRLIGAPAPYLSAVIISAMSISQRRRVLTGLTLMVLKNGNRHFYCRGSERDERAPALSSEAIALFPSLPRSYGIACCR